MDGMWNKVTHVYRKKDVKYLGHIVAVDLRMDLLVKVDRAVCDYLEFHDIMKICFFLIGSPHCLLFDA